MLDADLCEQFRRAMTDAGVEYHGEIIADGKRHRFPTKGDKKGEKSGFYILHADGIPAGAFGDWHSGEPGRFHKWCSKKNAEMSPEDRQAYAERMQKIQAAREAEKKKRAENARKRAQKMWDEAAPAHEHPYLSKRGINGSGARIGKDGKLLIPLKNADGAIQSLQRIFLFDGKFEKRFLPGGTVVGNSLIFGTNKKGPVYVVEGFATGATVHAATGQSVVVAFNTGNMEPVIAEIRRESPNREIIIAGDDDRFKQVNPGRTSAEAAAKKYRCKTIFPKFKTLEDKPTDFNDLAVREGIEEVRRQLRSTEPEQRKGFRLVPLANIEPRPPEYIVDKYLEKDNLAVVFGDPATAKSFVGIDLACCVGSETPFHGHPVLPGPVVYIAGEGQSGIARRFMAWGIRHGIDYRTLPVFVSMVPASMCDEEGALLVLDAIKNMDPKPVLIIFDTLARNFGPGDENSTADMGRFIGNADRIRAICGAAVLIIHHSGHGDKTRARGAMALKAGVDAEYHLTRDDTGVITMKNLKMKDAPPPSPISFRIRSVELPMTRDDGKPVTSAVLDDLVGHSEPVTRALLDLLKLEAAAENYFSRVELQRKPAGAKIRECLKSTNPAIKFSSDIPAALDILIQRKQLRPEQIVSGKTEKSVLIPVNNACKETREDAGKNSDSRDICNKSDMITREKDNAGNQNFAREKTNENNAITRENACSLREGETLSRVLPHQEGEGREKGTI